MCLPTPTSISVPTVKRTDLVLPLRLVALTNTVGQYETGDRVALSIVAKLQSSGCEDLKNPLAARNYGKSEARGTWIIQYSLVGCSLALRMDLTMSS
jgi:hypothetical protein